MLADCELALVLYGCITRALFLHSQEKVSRILMCMCDVQGEKPAGTQWESLCANVNINYGGNQAPFNEVDQCQSQVRNSFLQHQQHARDSQSRLSSRSHAFLALKTSSIRCSMAACGPSAEPDQGLQLVSTRTHETDRLKGALQTSTGPCS